MFDQMLKRMRKIAEVESEGTAMEQQIGLWSRMYHNRAPWLDEQVHSLNLASVIAAELARLATMEFSSQVTGSKRADFLSEQYAPVLRDLRTYTEFACAKGSVVLKPYVTGEKIGVDCVQADCFLPISFDSTGRLTGAVFADCLTSGKAQYLRLERHQLTADGYEICNYAYEKSGTSWKEIPLSAISKWADLTPKMKIDGVDKPLFAYLKMPGANTVDAASPLGVSVYQRAVELIEQADRQYSRLLWEFEGGELAIDASTEALGYDHNGKPRLPHLNKRLFRGLEIDAGGQDLYSVFSPRLRDESLLNGLNELLTRIEDACGLARGTISHPEGEVRTATELKMMRQRTYTTVRDIQKSLEAALRDLLYAINVWTELYHLAPGGNWEVSFRFDDNVLTDKSQEFSEKKQLVEAGILFPWEFRMWYLGESEEQAKEVLA
ncbi:MAG: phage portal protein [Ruminococcaceae bacterium]|nr:phage portal protein [Oscillospiraceae bacterium]